MERRDIAQGFVMQWALYFVAVYAAVIISNQAITFAGTIVICASFSFLAAIVTTIIFLTRNRRLTTK